MTLVREGVNTVLASLKEIVVLALGIPGNCACERVTLQGGHAPAACQMSCRHEHGPGGAQNLTGLMHGLLTEAQVLLTVFSALLLD